MKLRGRVTLKPDRERTLRGGNPWIFSHAVARIDPPDLRPGDGVAVHDASDNPLGYGYYHSATTIAVRMLAMGDAVAPDRIVDYRVAGALRLRSRLIRSDTNCYRLINGEGDGLPGIVVERYADVIVLQILTAGAEALRDEVIDALNSRLRPRAIIERSQGAVRRREGLADRVGIASGAAITEVRVFENGIPLLIDLAHGQKTGWFMDQRENRLRVRALARDARVLDLYCYGGGFALNALRGGAREVVGVDSSAPALDWARRNLALASSHNQDSRPDRGEPKQGVAMLGPSDSAVASDRCRFVQDDVARFLANPEPRFDIVVMDPPPLARSQKDAERAGRLYIWLNAQAMRTVAPGGTLFTFSCSAHFRGEEFVRAVRIAQGLAGRHFRVIEHLGAAPDHPQLLGHPEAEYLTGLWLEDLGAASSPAR
ncbi:MAG TPA: class I SAM-dependent rRNA methyltransferase [Candidatus Binataceae bacterium]|nr:class I SAM-dependent rRNA methyltransferase [Candidatus Binataceae bacterium]